MRGTHQLRCLVVGIGVCSLERRDDRCDSRQGIVRVGIRIEIHCPLLVSDAAQSVRCVEGEIRCGYRVSCSSALIPCNLGALAQSVEGLRDVLGGY